MGQLSSEEAAYRFKVNAEKQLYGNSPTEKLRQYENAANKYSGEERDKERRLGAFNTAMNQSAATSNAAQSSAQSAARRAGMNQANAAALASSQGVQGFKDKFGEYYNTDYANRKASDEQAIAAAKAKYDSAAQEESRKFNKFASIFASIFGVLSDERVKNIKAKWDKQKRGGCK